jgi:hypothetical protein
MAYYRMPDELLDWPNITEVSYQSCQAASNQVVIMSNEDQVRRLLWITVKGSVHDESLR